jgi:TBC1 domain family member 15
MLLTYLEYDTPSSPSAPNTSNHHPQNLGYVQGMSDLLAPIYAVMQDDAIAFWAFVSFMRRMSRNFVRDQSGMRAQLTTLDQLVQLLDPKLYVHLQSADSTNFFFFFRMLLVWYKREFEWSDVLRLWEGLWTDYLSSQFHLFIAVAILEKHRDVIMEHLKHFDEVLKYVNELSGTIDLASTLVRAEGLFRRFEKTVEAVDKKSHFPAPSGGPKQRRVVGPDCRSPSRGEAVAPIPVTTAGAASISSTSSAGMGRPPSQIGAAVAKGSGAEKEQVISPEMRALLSRKVVVLDEEEAASTSTSTSTNTQGVVVSASGSGGGGS